MDGEGYGARNAQCNKYRNALNYAMTLEIQL